MSARTSAAPKTYRHGLLYVVALTLLVTPLAVRAQKESADHDAIVLTYHKIIGEQIPNLQSYIQGTDRIRGLSQFDQHDAIQQSVTRLQSQLASADPSHEFSIRVNDDVSQYDFDRGEFTIMLFKPGSYVPLTAFGQQYMLVFSNPESLRALRLPKDQARAFDAQLNAVDRHVLDEIHFRVTGKGDPAGAVTGQSVVRAEILSARVLDAAGHVLLSPTIAPPSSSAAGAGVVKEFDIRLADVAGFRVGVKSKDLESALTRLFGATRRSSANATDWYAGSLTVNQMGCVNVPGRPEPKTGALCVVAFFDRDDVVRAIRIERVFQHFDSEVFRTSLIQKYGPVVASTNVGGSYAIGWGPEVDPKLLYDSSGPHNAVTAHYVNNQSFMSRASNNAAPPIRVVFHLVDAQWAALRR